MIKARYSACVRVTAFGFVCLSTLSGCTASKFLSHAQGNQFESAFGGPPTEASPGIYTTQLGEIEAISDSFVGDYQQTRDYPGSNTAPIAYKNERNEYIAMKMFEIDQAYYKYLTWIDIGDTGVVSAADFAQLGLTTAATAIPVVQTTKILSAAATAVGGAKSVYNADLLKTQTLQAIAVQMDADRATERNIIVARMAACTPQTYPMGFVLSDLQAYANAGTFEHALQSLASSATKAKQASSSPTSVANTGGGSGGTSASDPNSKSVAVNGGTLTYSFKATTQCPLVPSKTSTSSPKPPTKTASKQVTISGNIMITEPAAGTKPVTK
jgi:hypothetical protein